MAIRSSCKGEKSIKVEEFIQYIRDNKETTLLVIACSGSKRQDHECRDFPLGNNITTLTKLFPTLSEPLNEFRNCSKDHHPEALTSSSQAFPAFFRYSGYFYRQILLETWKKIEIEQWHLLILSAYFGFLYYSEPIPLYNLSMFKLHPECKRKLTLILQSYLNEMSEIKRVIFFTSKTYCNPFRGIFNSLNFKRLVLKDIANNEIMGPYGSTFYTYTGKLLSCILTGNYQEIEEIDEIQLNSV